jgi:CheY-like chemotaxis protein
LSRNAEAPDAGRRSPSRPDAQCPRALLADDDRDSREMYAEVLRAAGYSVVEAADGADALGRALAEPPDIIVMDLCMPRMNGWEAMRRLKMDARTCDIPLVALTAIGLEGRSLEVSCDAYLVKPCSSMELLAVVDTLMANPPNTSQTRLRASAPAS